MALFLCSFSFSLDIFNEGSGNFGSCLGKYTCPYAKENIASTDQTFSILADHLADLSNDVYIYCRSKATVDSFNNFNRNPKYLKGK